MSTNITQLTTGSTLILDYLPDSIARDGVIANYLVSIGETLTEFTKIRERKVRNQHWIDNAEGASLDRIGLGLANIKRFGDNDTQYRNRIKSVMSFDGGGNLNTLTGISNMEYNTGSWFQYNTLRYECNGGITVNTLGRCFGESGFATTFEFVTGGIHDLKNVNRFNNEVNQFRALGTRYVGFGQCIPPSQDEKTNTGGFYLYDVKGEGGNFLPLTPSLVTGDQLFGNDYVKLSFQSVSYNDTGDMGIVALLNTGRTVNLLESGHTFFNFAMRSDSAGMTLRKVKLISSLTMNPSCEGNFKYKIPLTLTESSGIDRTNEYVSVDVSVSNDCFYDSVRLYENNCSGTEVTSVVWNALNNAWETFNSDTDWTSDLTNWTETIGSGGILQLLPHYMGYKKVVQITRAGDDVSMHTAVTPGDNGIGFLVRPAQVTGILELKTFENNDATGNVLIYMKFDSDGNIKYVDSGGTSQTIQSYSADAWYYVEARNIDHSAATYDIYVNGTLKVTDATMRNTGTSSDSIEIDCVGDGTFYVGCVDHGGDTDWSAGRLMYLTSFTISFLATVNANSTKNY
ncbi:MAG: hypothetical protein DRH04_06865, partial [Deltaproteobacteria bacterium]